ncbi:MAG TPA: cbb3-type cytochrome c oxidase subunit 3 [Bauldia sp.]|nr:cbb3-type cytochrome c oxidase subunit 3 [Bauldia sp.]
MDAYTAAAEFAQSWGLIYFFVVFCAVVAFVLWPGRKKKFDDASFIPLREDEE